MIQDVLNLIHNRQFQAARDALEDLNPVDLAEEFEELNTFELTKVFRMLTKNMAADVFAYFSRDLQMRIIEMITDRELEIGRAHV